MAWYKTGTVTVTNGSTTVTGAGTAFVGAVLAGHGFAAPDGKLYEIDAVVSATQITLASPYLGATAAGATYGIFPTNGALTPFATRLDTALSGMQSVIDGAGQGKFAAGTPAAPGMRFTADGDTGFTNPAANQIGMVTGGVLRALLSGTAFNLSVPLTGTAVTQTAIDTTAGRLLKTGDFGIGVATDNQVAALRIDDASVNLPGGFFSGPGSGGINYPDSNTRFSPFINMLRRVGTGSYAQIRMFFSGLRPIIGSKASGGAWTYDSALMASDVTTSAVDTTAGRLTKVGDFGLGSFGSNPGALDYSTLGGVSQIISDSITPTPADKPTLGRAFAGLHLAAAANRWVQFLAEVAGGSDPAKLWFRRNYSGAVSAWQQIFSQGNILGTVSQASGVPTGAIIERGSNANGEYVRFADGTQICSAALLSDAGAAKSWTFPAAFSAVPNVTGSAIATVLSALCLDAAPTTTAATFSARDKTDARRADTCHLIARGRWF